MASATFSLKAVDETRAAFASVQNSLARLNSTSATVGKTLKTIMMGGLSKSLFKGLDMMSDKLDKIITEGDDLGFGQSVEDALRLKSIIDGFFKLLLIIPSLLAKAGIEIVDLVKGSSEAEIKAEATALWQKRFKKEIEGSVESMQNLQVEFDKANSTSEEWADSLREAAEQSFIQSQELFAANQQIDKAYKLQENGLKLLLEEDALRKKIFEEQSKADNEYTIALGKRNAAELALIKLVSKKTTPEQELNLLYKDRLSLEESLTRIQGTGISATKLRTNIEEDLTRVLENILELEKQRRQFGEEFGSRIADSFEEAILSGNKLKEVIRSLAQDLLRMIFREQITKPMASGLGNFFANLFTGKAAGGPVSGGTPYMVGEKGPELFVPGSSGSIVPNHRLSSEGGGGSPVIVNYHIAAGVTRSELVPILETERKRLKAEIPDMVRRGGAYRAAFA